MLPKHDAKQFSRTAHAGLAAGLAGDISLRGAADGIEWAESRSHLELFEHPATSLTHPGSGARDLASEFMPHEVCYRIHVQPSVPTARETSLPNR